MNIFLPILTFFNIVFQLFNQMTFFATLLITVE